jgi:hypothetical protein
MEGWQDAYGDEVCIECLACLSTALEELAAGGQGKYIRNSRMETYNPIEALLQK